MDEGRFNKLVKRILKQSSKKFSLWVNVMRIFVNLVGIENLLKYVFFFFFVRTLYGTIFNEIKNKN